MDGPCGGSDTRATPGCLSGGLFYFIFSFFSSSEPAGPRNVNIFNGREAGKGDEGQWCIKGALASKGRRHQLRSRVHSDSGPRARLSGSNQSLLVLYTSQYIYSLLYTPFEPVFELSLCAFATRRNAWLSIRLRFEATSKPRIFFEPRSRGSIRSLECLYLRKPFATLRRSDLCTQTRPTFLVFPLYHS